MSYRIGMVAVMKLSDYLAQQGESQPSFAARIGVQQASVSRYVTGERHPDWDVLERIVRATGGAVTADDFMIGSLAVPDAAPPPQSPSGSAE